MIPVVVFLVMMGLFFAAEGTRKPRTFKELTPKNLVITYKLFDESNTCIEHRETRYNAVGHCDDLVVHEAEVQKPKVGDVSDDLLLINAQTTQGHTTCKQQILVEESMYSAIDNDDYAALHFYSLLDVNINYQRPNDSMTLLAYAVNKPENSSWVKTVQLLLEAGARVSSLDKQGNSIVDAPCLKEGNGDQFPYLFDDAVTLAHKGKERATIKALLESYRKKESNSLCTTA